MRTAPDVSPATTAKNQSFSSRDLRDGFALFATGVAVITGVRPDGQPVGITANSLTSVSLDPPLLLWCLASRSPSAVAFAPEARFAVHILAHHQRDLALHFARGGREKFETDHHWRCDPQPPRLADALCRFDCQVRTVYPGGDHLIIVGEVLALAATSAVPLTFHGGRFGGFAADPGSPHLKVWQSLRDEWI